MRTPIEKLTQVFEIHPFDPERCGQDLAAINVELAQQRKFSQTKLVSVTRHDEPVITYALVKSLQRVEAELKILQLSRDRDLTREERWQLPANLQRFSREELMEQINPWITLKMDIESLIEDFKFEEQPPQSSPETSENDPAQEPNGE